MTGSPSLSSRSPSGPEAGVEAGQTVGVGNAAGKMCGAGDEFQAVDQGGVLGQVGLEGRQRRKTVTGILQCQYRVACVGAAVDEA